MYKLLANVGTWNNLHVCRAASPELRSFSPAELRSGVQENGFVAYRMRHRVGMDGARSNAIWLIAEDASTGLSVLSVLETKAANNLDHIVHANDREQVKSDILKLVESCREIDTVFASPHSESGKKADVPESTRRSVLPAFMLGLLSLLYAGYVHWQALAVQPVPGPVGPQGQIGPQGPVGPRGEPGEHGRDGLGIQIGMMLMFKGDEPPEGWLFCNGETVNADEYPELADVLNADGTQIQLPVVDVWPRDRNLNAIIRAK